MLPPSGEFRFSWVRECQRFVHSLLRDTKDTNAVDKGEREKERERERETEEKDAGARKQGVEKTDETERINGLALERVVLKKNALTSASLGRKKTRMKGTKKDKKAENKEDNVHDEIRESSIAVSTEILV